MTETSFFWQSTSPGDAGPYSASQFQRFIQYAIGIGASRPNVGPMLGSGTQPNNGLKVQAKSVPTTSIDVLAGSALLQGALHISDATVSFVIAANGSGNPRIDTVILRADYALQTVRLAVLQGTPAASPVNPTLTQNANVLWEIPLADIAVANGFSTITNANITPRHEWANAASGVYLDNVFNNSGSTLVDGDVVIWDATADRAVTVGTTFDDPLLAGVWRGRTDNAGYGRVQVSGIGYVNASAAVTRGDVLTSSATTKRAASQFLISLNATIGIALETTSGSGYVLTRINIHRIFQADGYQAFATPQGYNPVNTYASNATIAAVSGTILIPITLSGHMLLQAVSVLNNDATNPRTWNWGLYVDDYNNANAIRRVAVGTAVDTFTPGAASIRTIVAANAPVYLKPGSYWLAIQNQHATNTFALGNNQVGGNFAITTSKSKTTGGVNGATLDIIAATWTLLTGAQAVTLRGRAAGDSAAW